MKTIPDILQRIIESKQQEINEQSQQQSLANIQASLIQAPPLRNFTTALSTRMNAGHPAVIAEIKRASPSKGLLREDFNPTYLAQNYQQGGATCLSVLTDKQFFQGSTEDLIAAKAACTLPVLRKDFIIDAYQVYQTRAIGADAILLIAACLDDTTLHQLTRLAQELKLSVLLEIRDAMELERALLVKPNVIGINNRDLRTFNTDLYTTLNLIAKVPAKYLLVTESGIRSRADVELMSSHGVHGFLVGEAFMRAPNPGARLAELFA